MVWLTAVLAVAGVASAVFAFVQAKAAKGSRRDAQEARDEAQSARDESAKLAKKATDAFVRQAEAQEKANALKEREMTPPDWTGPKYVDTNRYRVVNTSTRTLFVDSFIVDPPDAGALFRMEGDAPGVYAYGDSFDYIAIQAGGMRPKKLTVVYRLEIGGEEHQLLVPL